jgi:hypothetical protein
MTTAELITRVRSLVGYDLDVFFSGSGTDAEVVTVLNDSLREIASMVGIYSDVNLTTTAGTNVYAFENSAFSRTPIRIDAVYVDGNPLIDETGRIGIYPYGVFNNVYRDWRSATQGTISRASVLNDSLILYLTPNATKTLVVSCQHYPLPLDAATGSASPELPLDLHAALAAEAAYRIAMPTAIEAQQINRLALMRADADTAIKRARRRLQDERKRFDPAVRRRFV